MTLVCFHLGTIGKFGSKMFADLEEVEIVGESTALRYYRYEVTKI